MKRTKKITTAIIIFFLIIVIIIVGRYAIGLYFKKKFSKRPPPGVIVEVITNKIGAANNNYYSLSTEVFNICKLAQEALSDIPSEEELQVALIDCWSRITVWREKIGPNLIEKMSNYHSW